MIVLLIALLFGVGFAYLATQNTSGVTLTIVNYVFHNIPLYLIVLVSLIIGVTITLILSAVHELSTFFILRKKENAIKELKKTLAELIKRVHQLELEKAKNGNSKETLDDDKSL